MSVADELVEQMSRNDAPLRMCGYKNYICGMKVFHPLLVPEEMGIDSEAGSEREISATDRRCILVYLPFNGPITLKWHSCYLLEFKTMVFFELLQCGARHIDKLAT